ncbi:hypothetical protein [Priestia megaterium]|nr:hypothetical protein [Priestia megaterium]CAH0304695.1 hypothetical protein SRABI82_04682 [Priestia megaterium]
MKVNELIDLLKNMPQDAEVVIAPCDFVECDIEDVKSNGGKVYITDTN